MTFKAITKDVALLKLGQKSIFYNIGSTAKVDKNKINIQAAFLTQNIDLMHDFLKSDQNQS